MWVYQDLHKTGLKGIFISLEMNLGQNNCLNMDKRVAKNIALTALVFNKSLFEVCLRFW